MNIEELKMLAEAATPGPWSESDGYAGVVAGKQFVAQAYGDRRADCINNAAYIAAANPATILALIAERDELLANIPEWHCKICNTIHLPPSGFNLCCHTPKCTGMLKPSSQSIRIAEDQRDEALAKLDRAQAEIRALESKLLEREAS